MEGGDQSNGETLENASMSSSSSSMAQNRNWTPPRRPPPVLPWAPVAPRTLRRFADANDHLKRRRLLIHDDTTDDDDIQHRDGSPTKSSENGSGECGARNPCGAPVVNLSGSPDYPLLGGGDSNLTPSSNIHLEKEKEVHQ